MSNNENDEEDLSSVVAKKKKRGPEWRWSPQEIGIIENAVVTNAPMEPTIQSIRSINSQRSATAIAVRFNAELKTELKKQDMRSYQHALVAAINKRHHQHQQSLAAATNTSTTTQPSILQNLFNEVSVIRKSDLPQNLKDELCLIKKAKIDHEFEKL
jgi:hypothetical protein